MSEKWKNRCKKWKEEYDEECRNIDPALFGFTLFVGLMVVALISFNILLAIAFGIAAGMFRRIIKVRKKDEEKAKNPAGNPVDQSPTEGTDTVE